MRLRLVASLFLLALVGCKDPIQEAAKTSLAQLPAHLQEGRTAAQNLTQGLPALLTALAPSIAQPLAERNVDRIRYQLIEMNTRTTDAGSLTLYPAGFLVAIGADGVVIARNIAAADDQFRGLAMGGMFPCIRAAIANGTAGLCPGEMPGEPGQPPRVVLVGVAPVRGTDGANVGAIAAGITYGNLARAIERAVRLRAGAQPVLWVGLQRDGRILPSGQDRDVPARWLFPPALIRALPSDLATRAANAPHTFTFIEQGARGWAGGATALSNIDGTFLVIYRSEASQR